jgi:hypothetical protein
MPRRAYLWLAGLALVVAALLLTDRLLWRPGLTEDNVCRIRSGMALAVQAGSSATVNDSTISHNKASGGEEGAGGSDGHGVGGGVYNLGTFAFDIVSVIKKNHAATSNDDIFP